MPIVTSSFTLALPPKCGCIWVLSALPASDVVLGRRANQHILVPGRVDGLPSITCVRSVDSVLLSYWSNRDKLGPTRVGPVDVLIDLAKQCEDFKRFIDRYLDHHAGLVQRIFALYESDHVVRTDKIGPDMARVFKEIGIGFNASVLREFPVRNQTWDKPRWPRGLKKRVIEAEA